MRGFLLFLVVHVVLSKSELKRAVPVHSLGQIRMRDGSTAGAGVIGFASLVGRACMPPRFVRNRAGILQLVCKTKKSIARQREEMDKILEIFKRGGEASLQDAHKELVHIPEVPWDKLPKELDPHWVTFRGVKLESGLNWTRKKMMENLNPRSVRKRAQVESFYAALSLLNPEKGSTVVDFGSGSGNLVLPLAHLMPDLNFVAVDLKAEAMQILQERSQAAGLKNCRVHTGYIEDFKESFDFALGLHVCGPASNAVMDSAIESNAAFLLSPCCIGKLRTGAQASVSLGPPGQGQQQRQYPMSRWMGRRIDSETFELVAQAADRSEVRTEIFHKSQICLCCHGFHSRTLRCPTRTILIFSKVPDVVLLYVPRCPP